MFSSLLRQSPFKTRRTYISSAALTTLCLCYRLHEPGGFWVCFRSRSGRAGLRGPSFHPLPVVLIMIQTLYAPVLQTVVVPVIIHKSFFSSFLFIVKCLAISRSTFQFSFCYFRCPSSCFLSTRSFYDNNLNLPVPLSFYPRNFWFISVAREGEAARHVRLSQCFPCSIHHFILLLQGLGIDAEEVFQT